MTSQADPEPKKIKAALASGLGKVYTRHGFVARLCGVADRDNSRRSNEPKAAALFARGGGMAGMGRLDHAAEILAGRAGTRIAAMTWRAPTHA
ncbi:hypothetical protein [Oceaniglobus ichthyenteri]|uniref:hypothetical protein n=1 Tax=Oceaniglobus ichthyenteri TaxID=2136177 RepID=UPI000D357B42|nr:hypothetical protein [Oceaniglobus ichthyenteri]